MSDIRNDQFTHRQVLVVEGRAKRPRDFELRPQQLATQKYVQDCPFCESNEPETPPELWAARELGKSNSPGWQIRVIPNKYPVNNSHELIIETPVHGFDLPELSDVEITNVLQCYQDRVRLMLESPEVHYALLFKNYGFLAGATKAHTHVQVVGHGAIPPLIQEEVGLARHYYESTGTCIYCEMIESELDADARIISESENFVVLAPYAARFPYESWILPRMHSHDFPSENPERLSELGACIQSLIERLRTILSDREWAYNFHFHTAPTKLKKQNELQRVFRSYHWHIELFPRITTPAGLEWGGGIFVNSVSPESAAEILREVKI